MPVMTEELFKALQLLAAKATVSPDWEDYYRRLCRWYSKEFSTPLTEVYKLAEEEVVKTYFEEIYQGMSQRTDDEGKASWEDILEDITSTDAEKRAKAEAEKSEEEDDSEWYKEELERLRTAESEKSKSLQEDNLEYSEENGFKVKPNLMGELPDHIFAKGEEHLAEYGVDTDDSADNDTKEDD